MLEIEKIEFLETEIGIEEMGSVEGQVENLVAGQETVGVSIISCSASLRLFKLLTNHTLSIRSLGDIRQIDDFLPILLNLLDERDAEAKAIVKLLAEYCSMCSNANCLYEVLKCIFSQNVVQRRNDVDVVADLIHITSGSVDTLSEDEWQDVANNLLECLGDEDEAIKRVLGVVMCSCLCGCIVRTVHTSQIIEF
ncbi:hypothetical protein C2S51_022363 [Perilla frutescens var. frutescens]|nr:hypothetical protein C2S51_022363 [Perilla frutescens var. frutescens]